jgi:hypothetical protein
MDLQLSIQSVPIITNVVSSNHAHGGVYSIQHFVINFVSDLRQVGGQDTFSFQVGIVEKLISIQKCCFEKGQILYRYQVHCIQCVHCWMGIVKYFIFLQAIHYTPQYIVGWGLLSTSYFYKLYI